MSRRRIRITILFFYTFSLITLCGTNLQGMQLLPFGQTLTGQQLTSQGSSMYWVQVDSGQKVVAVLEKTGPQSSCIRIAENATPPAPYYSTEFTTLDDAAKTEATKDGYCNIRVDSGTNDTLNFNITAYDQTTMPTLATGQTLTDSLTWAGDSKFYQVKADSGQRVLVALEKLSGGSSSLRIGQNIIPSLPYYSTDYTIRGESASNDVIKDGYCYIRVVSYSNFTYSFNISAVVQGEGRPKPDISLSATSVTIGEVAVGGVGNGSFQIKNEGDADLVVSGISSNNPVFSAEPASATIAAGQSRTVTVTFRPAFTGSQSAAITIISNDSDEGTLTVSVTGMGISAAKSCDFTGDGRTSIHDVIAFLILGRDHPGDTRLDWNSDGKYTVADAISLWTDISRGKCSSSGAQLASGFEPQFSTEFRGLSSEDIRYLEKMLSLMALSPEDESLFHLALYGQSGKAALPKAFSLSQNYPNPFNPVTAISYSVPEGYSVPVTLEVYDLRGRLVRGLVNSPREPGSYTVIWDGRDQSGREVPSGAYLYRLSAGGFTQIRKMVLMK